MASSYPGGIDSFTNPSATDSLDSATVPHAAQHANINDAVEAIEGTLGTNPQGASATVVARLNTVDSTVAGKVASVTAGDSTITVAGTATAPTVAVNAIAPSKVTGTAVVTSDARLSDTRIPTDASVTDDKIATTLSPSKITGTAVVTSDSRLSDTRTPTDASVTNAKIASAGLAQSSLTSNVIADWAASTAYARNDLVNYLGVAYSRISAGTSGATFDSAMWNAQTPALSAVAANITSIPRTSVSGTAAVLGSANAFTVGGHTITAESAAIIPLRINGAASQSGNLTEWRDSAGTLLSFVNSAGGISLPRTTSLRFNAGVGFDRAFITSNSSNDLIFAPAGGTESFRLYGGATPAGAILTNGTGNFASLIIKATASQIADQLQSQTSAGTINGGRNAVSQIYSGSTSTITSAVGGTIQSIATGANPLVTMASAHGLAVGDLVTLAGTTGSTYNGTFVIATVPATTTFTITTALTTGQAGTGGTVAVPAQASITSRSAGTKGLVIKGATSQAVSAFEIQNSAGTVVATLGSNGVLNLANRILVNSASDSGSGVAINTSTTTWTGTTITSVSGQLADLIQLRNSTPTNLGGRNALAQIYSGSTTTINSGVGGATTAASGDGTTATLTMTSATNLAVGDLIVVAGVTPTGYNTTGAVVTAVSNSSPFTVSYANSTSGAQTVAGTVSAPAQASITARSAGTTALIVRNAASSTKDLAQFQNSAGTSVGRVNSNGYWVGGNFTTNSRVGLEEVGSVGTLNFQGATTSTITNPGANRLVIAVKDGTTAGTLKLVVRAGTAGAETTILDNIPQT
jgi:hypothetical protein